MITLDLNSSVNPCLLTSQGEFAPDSHQIYVTVNNTNSQLYHEFGWYLASFWISSPQLSTIPREEFSKILKETEKDLNLEIGGLTKEQIKKQFSIAVELMVDHINQNLQKSKYGEVQVSLTSYSTQQNYLEKIIDKVASVVKMRE